MGEGIHRVQPALERPAFSERLFAAVWEATLDGIFVFLNLKFQFGFVNS